MRIVAEHLSYVYNPKSPFETAALKDVSLTIEEGEFFGIIGHTGSGKSTFVQHLNGLIRLPSSLRRYKKKKPKKGEIPPPETVLRVGEFDLTDKKTDFRALRKSVGMVFQYPEYQLFEIDVFSDVCFGPKNLGLPKEEVEERARRALELVGIGEEYYNQSPFDLSGGQKRRVAIAGVLAMNPDVLVLDGIRRKVTRNSENALNQTDLTQWPLLAPGSNIMTAPDAMTVEYYPIYL